MIFRTSKFNKKGCVTDKNSISGILELYYQTVYFNASLEHNIVHNSLNNYFIM